MWDHMQFGWEMMTGLHALWWVLGVVALVAVVAWAVALPSRRDTDAGSRARAILEERYARGEIGKDEFETKMRDLSA
jgi:putative membrane protein